MMVFHTETCRSFLMAISMQIQLLRLSNFASVGEKNFDNNKGTGYVRENCYPVFSFFGSLES